MTRPFEFGVNGRPVHVTDAPDVSLLSVLRGRLNLTGTRFGCGTGSCGACSVRLDDSVVPSCDTPLWAVEGRSVTTVEGLGNCSGPHPIQQAVLDEQAAQCGFCLSGILIRAAALLDENPDPTPAEVAAALERNLCRCGAHRRIIRAVLRAGGQVS